MAFIPPPQMTAPPPSAEMVGISGMNFSQTPDVPQSQPPDGSVMKLFYTIESALETLSGAVPSEAGKLDAIKSSLREVLNNVLSAGPRQDTGPNLLNGGGEASY